jgi:hypothetical protein
MARRPVYAASPVKPRRRATKVEMVERFGRLFAICEAQQPLSVRGCFYQAEVAGIVEKLDSGYDKVQRALVRMRRSGQIPWGWITDLTRVMRKPRTWTDPAEAIRQTAETYRKALWANADVSVEIWMEKLALIGVVLPVTAEYDVPLMIARGYSSLTFLQSAAADIEEDGRPAFIYHLGDHDPSGVDAARKVEETLRELAPSAEIHFQRLAVLPWQIEAWSLPRRPTKMSDSRSKRWTGGDSVELDAVEPNRLRAIVREAIEQHLPEAELGRLSQIEEAERRSILQFAAAWEERL